ncbi:MFS transporter [Psittacicella gerlachiana]|uniref:Major facilitator superfamily (MFS) profile domain-containing protein n=1 Tax=Psittacicella gerlachiana TaxID=2028574 RepID=A0A3A1YM76_9GAMM|nr:MFS transporter [Psittacicella gerlachiana]RIY38566.1 hypothetical protein CKF59_00575 [Psittacicella gerlachiana]
MSDNNYAENAIPPQKNKSSYQVVSASSVSQRLATQANNSSLSPEQKQSTSEVGKEKSSPSQRYHTTELQGRATGRKAFWDYHRYDPEQEDNFVQKNTKPVVNSAVTPRDVAQPQNPQLKSQVKTPQASSYDVVTPYQKSLQKKLPSAYFMVILLSIVSITPGLANTSFNPAIMEIASEYQVSLANIQALSATYFLGLGCGQLLWGPLTDRFGRKKSIITCTLLAVLINFIFINTQTYEQLQTARFFQGVIFSCFGLLPTAVLRDSYSARNFIIYNSWVMILFLLAPAFAPLFGGYVLISLGWKWIFNILSAICVFGLLCFLTKIPETLDPTRKQPINPVAIAKNYFTILKNFKSLLCLSLGGLMAVVLFAWTALCSALLINDYHISPQNIGYYSIFPVIFTIIANKLNGSLVKYHSPQKILVYSTLLQAVCAGANFLVAFYFLGPIGLVIAQTLNALFTGFQNANLVSIYLMDYSHMVGTASSLFLSIRTIIPSILIFIISFEPRYMGKTFLFFDAAVIFVGLFIALLFNYLYPAPGARMHALRIKAIKLHKKQMQARFGSPH